MKKIAILTAVTLGSLLVFSSCDLNIYPDTSIRGEDAYTFEYVEGERLGVYSGLKTVCSGAYLYNADYQTDLFNETLMSGNRGGFFHRWILYPSDSDVTGIWSGYYSLINRINYTIRAIDVVSEKDGSANLSTLALYRAEMCMLRAYTIDQLVLRFCEDYEPDLAASQYGVPYPTEFDPDAKLPRGTLADTYAKIKADIASAETLLRTVQGEADNIFLSGDALTAFKAQVALQMHEWADAANLASSLYAMYPLVETKADLERMWREDTSSETIFQPEVVTASLASVGSMYDYYSGTWSPTALAYNCQPGYALEQGIVDRYDLSADLRVGVYIDYSRVYYQGVYNGYLLTKFLGNKLFQTSKTIYAYRNMPKIFRIADMYLIEAEAQYRAGGTTTALAPLNTLREARGLSALSDLSGDALFTEIKNERIREMLGEGQRLTDLKRWHEGIVRDYQEGLRSVLRGYLFNIPADTYMFVWPIPQLEMANNPNIGNQNAGYLQ